MQGQQRALSPVLRCFLSFEMGFNARNGVAMKSKTKKERKGKVTQKMSPKSDAVGEHIFCQERKYEKVGQFPSMPLPLRCKAKANGNSQTK